MATTLFQQKIAQRYPHSEVVQEFSVEHHNDWDCDTEIAVVHLSDQVSDRNVLITTNHGDLELVNDVEYLLGTVDIFKACGTSDSVQVDAEAVTALLD